MFVFLKTDFIKENTYALDNYNSSFGALGPRFWIWRCRDWISDSYIARRRGHCVDPSTGSRSERLETKIHLTVRKAGMPWVKPLF